MSATSIGTVTSRLRALIKAERQDSFITDKYLYSLFRKHAALSIKRLDEKGKLIKFSSVFETLDYVELVECDKVEAGCTGIKSYSTFRKTKLDMPMFTEGVYGPMVNSITSLDGSTIFTLVRNSDIYNYMTTQPNFRYNTTKYCWFLNDKLYFPNVDYPAVRIEGLFEEDIAAFKCDYDTKCKPRQQQSLNIPDYLLPEIEASVLKDLAFELQIPSDDLHDNRNPNR